MSALTAVEQAQAVENDQQRCPDVGRNSAPEGGKTNHRQAGKHELHGDGEGDVLMDDAERRARVADKPR